jgi:hypothetical protein
MKLSNNQYFVLFVTAILVVTSLTVLDAVRIGEPSLPMLLSTAVAMSGWVVNKSDKR